MAGHVRKRGNSWELIAYSGRDPLTGRKRYVTRSFKGTKRAAEQAVARLVTEVEALPQWSRPVNGAVTENSTRRGTQIPGCRNGAAP